MARNIRFDDKRIKAFQGDYPTLLSGESEMTKPSLFEYSFSVEEFAVIMSVAGRADEAKGLLTSQLGMLSSEEERGRLLSANHSLLARNLLSIRDSQVQVDTDVSELMEKLFMSTSLCRFGRTGKFGEDVLTYYYVSDGLLEHAMSDGVVHRFRFPIPIKDVDNRVWSFFSPVSAARKEDLSLELPIGFITEFDFSNLRTFAKVIEIITKNSAQTRAAEAFAEDLANGSWRGSMIWIDHEFEDRTFGRGSFCFQGPTHLWLINFVGKSEPPKLRAYQVNMKEFRKHIRSIVATQRP